MILTAPAKVEWLTLWGETTVFLGGSIEQGTARDWQREAANEISEWATVLNPRRENWDPDWPQDPDFEPFREQVEWELKALDNCDKILLHFEPGTKSPITLLELGLIVTETPEWNLFVSCPEGFWRRGNVQIVCERYGIPVYDSLDEAIAKLKEAV